MIEMTQEQAQSMLAQRIPSYRIEKKLGKGMYGAVFLAYDKDTEQRYAVKLFHLEAKREISAKDGRLTDATTRLNRDWRHLMHHHTQFKSCPALVEIPMFFKVDAQENIRGKVSAWGIAVMAYYPSNLHDYVLDHMEDYGKPLPALKRLTLLRELAKALEILHGMTDIDGHPFVYEDLKPENILVNDISDNDSLQVVIGDIGGLKRIGGSSASSGGQVTLNYAAPEVFIPPKQRVDQQSVVYSFGLVGYFVIEGRVPYSEIELIERCDQIESDPGFTPTMTEGLKPAAEVIRRCLRIDRAERYADFASVSQALQKRRSGSGPTIRPTRDPREEATKKRLEKETKRKQEEELKKSLEKKIRKEMEKEIKAKLEAERIVRQQLPSIGDEWHCPLTGMVFLWVPGGTFQMGDLFGDGRDNEKPVHTVILSGFWMGKYPVTQGEWVKMMKNNPSRFKEGDNYPVETVSWKDVQEFIKKLNDSGDGKYRMPTEAEWEYACRSGGKKERYAGGNNLDQVAWCHKNSGGSTHPVGQKVPNGLGLYDMSGNVWEWVSDWYGKYHANAPHENPQGPSEGSYRVNRGGGWNVGPAFVRSARRDGSGPGLRSNDVGFRISRTSP